MKVILIFIVLVFLSSCKSKQDYMLKQGQIDSTLVKCLEENLETAFKEKKIELLDSFLLNWNDRYDYKKKISDPIEQFQPCQREL